jgi:hypothetical protein
MNYCFARMDFSEQYHIDDKARDMRYDEKSILNKSMIVEDFPM